MHKNNIDITKKNNIDITKKNNIDITKKTHAGRHYAALTARAHSA